MSRTSKSPRAVALEALATADAFGCFGLTRRAALWAAGAAAQVGEHSQVPLAQAALVLQGYASSIRHTSSQPSPSPRLPSSQPSPSGPMR